MGCTPIKRHTPLERKDTPIGVVSVSIIGLHLHDIPKQAQPNIKIRVSNQHFTISNMHLIGGSSMKAQENTYDTFNFIINSFYKPCGRSLQIGYFSAETILFYGAFDLNIILDHKGEHQFRCILTDRHAERGYVLARASFEPLPYYEFNFRFETATIRRKVSSQGVAVRITIGQEMLQTEYQKDIPQSPPYWEDKKYNFKVPKIVVKGYLQLINQLGDIIGRAEIILQNLYCVKEGQEILQSQQLFSREKESQVVVADLKYSFILGKSNNFAPRTGELTSTITGKRYRNEGETEIRSSGNE